jgi:intein-encoded DNA endonuclease-like protein
MDTYRISLKLCLQDMLTVEKVLYFFGAWNSHEQVSKNKNRQDTKCLRSGDRRFIKFLRENGYKDKSRISPSLILGKIPRDLHYLFWRGFFDGDGCISISNGDKFASICLAGSYSQDWTDLENLLKFLNIKYRIERKIQHSRSRGSKILFCSNAGVFCEYIYFNRENDKIGLDRKYIKFLKLKELRKNIGFASVKPGRNENGRFVRFNGQNGNT